MNNPLMEAGSEEMEVRGSRRWGQGEAWEGFWVARAEEELGRTHMGGTGGGGLQDRGGASLCGDRLEEEETSRHDGLVKYLTPEAR